MALPASSQNVLLILHLASTGSDAVRTAVARSYAGYGWESVLPSPLQPNCSLGASGYVGCTIFADPSTSYSITRHVRGGARTVTAAQAAARFLQQSTFGPNLAQVGSLLEGSVIDDATPSNDEDVSAIAAWIGHQMELSPSLVRSHVRRHTNTRALLGAGLQPESVNGAGGSIGTGERTNITHVAMYTVCDIGSRWHVYAFSQHDEGKVVVVVPDQARGMFSLYISGVLRLQTSRFAGVQLYPGQGYTRFLSGTTVQQHYDTSAAPDASMSACNGICESSAQCADGLTCFERSPTSLEPVPGCAGTGIIGTGYCYNESAAESVEVPQAPLVTATYEICTAVERVDAAVMLKMISPTTRTGCHVHAENEMINFIDPVDPSATHVQVHQSGELELGEVKTPAGGAYFVRSRNNGVQCTLEPAQGKAFIGIPDASTEGGIVFYTNDWRLKYLANTVEAPVEPTASDLTFMESCPATPKTWLNEKSCVLLQPGPCGDDFESCGSRGEVNNNPSLGNNYNNLGMDQTRAQGLDMAYTYHASKWNAWQNVILTAPDQLRHRVAWALSQIFAMGNVQGQRYHWQETAEMWGAYYDIFVANAFGSYLDIMREVSRNPLMARWLSFFRSTKAKNGQFPVRFICIAPWAWSCCLWRDPHQSPHTYRFFSRALLRPFLLRAPLLKFKDENFARELMQLFSIGIVELNIDGTAKHDAVTGLPVDSYSNADIMSFARVWTGWRLQRNDAVRTNVEGTCGNGMPRSCSNYIDPVHLNPEVHDLSPKTSLHGGYLGDGYPLCAALPERSFLLAGAKYHKSGATSILGSGDGLYDNDLGGRRRMHFMPTPETSQLYAALCARSQVTGLCTFPHDVTLPTTLPCDGDVECGADTLRAVKMIDGSQTVFYSFVEPPCVDLQFFEGGRGKRQADVQRCADPTATRTANAGAACCAEDSNGAVDLVSSGGPECLYIAEPVSYATAARRCAAAYVNGTLCPHSQIRTMGTSRTSYTNADGTSPDWLKACSGYHHTWTTAPCRLKVEVTAAGEVSLERSRYVGNTDDLSFPVHWAPPTTPTSSGLRYPTASDGSCSETAGCEVLLDSGESCYCDLSVETVAVYVDASAPVPPIDELRSTLFIASAAPADFGHNVYTLCTTAACVAQPGVAVHTRGCTPEPIQFDADTVFEIVDATPGRYGRRQTKYLLNRASTVVIGNQNADNIVFSFRNPTNHMPNIGAEITLPNGTHPYAARVGTKQSAEYETEALLTHLFEHPNTAPFVGKQLIQKMVTSNPSPRYVTAVASAFRDGSYDGTTYSGGYGDLRAAVAAVLLDREARTTVLDADPSHGKLQESLIKVTSLMRGMEYTSRPGVNQIALSELMPKIGQQAFESPSVFNFFSHSYAPHGPIRYSRLDAPEAEIATTPYYMGFLSGITGLIDHGLTFCLGGFGDRYRWNMVDQHSNISHVQGYVSLCGDGSPKAVSSLNDGRLRFTPTQPSNPVAAIDELALVLTPGRLSDQSRSHLTDVYASYLKTITLDLRTIVRDTRDSASFTLLSERTRCKPNWPTQSGGLGRRPPLFPNMDAAAGDLRLSDDHWRGSARALKFDGGGYIASLETCAALCQGKAQLFMFGLPPKRCVADGCKCYCVAPGGSSNDCTVTPDRGYNLYRYRAFETFMQRTIQHPGRHSDCEGWERNVALRKHVQASGVAIGMLSQPGAVVDGFRVSASLSCAQTSGAPAPVCDIFSWEDTSLVCGSCRVLASSMDTHATCSAFCAAQTGGLMCFGAWEAAENNCLATTAVDCGHDFAALGVSDAICECVPPGPSADEPATNLGDPSWFMVDLGAMYTIASLELNRLEKFAFGEAGDEGWTIYVGSTSPSSPYYTLASTQLDTCGAGLVAVSEEDCYTAVEELVPNGATIGHASLLVTFDAIRPSGCSMHLTLWTANWNTNPDRHANASYAKVCAGLGPDMDDVGSLGDVCADSILASGTFDCLAPIAGRYITVTSPSQMGLCELEAFEPCAGQGRHCSEHLNGVLQEFVPEDGTTLNGASQAWEDCEAFCQQSPLCTACSPVCVATEDNVSVGTCQFNAVPSCGSLQSDPVGWAQVSHKVPVTIELPTELGCTGVAGTRRDPLVWLPDGHSVQSTREACWLRCNARSECEYWSFHGNGDNHAHTLRGDCYLHSDSLTTTEPVLSSSWTSGTSCRDSDPGLAIDLGKCTQQCDADSQCAPGLRCFTRSNYESDFYRNVIPGCSGTAPHSNGGYCYNPADRGTGHRGLTSQSSQSSAGGTSDSLVDGDFSTVASTEKSTNPWLAVHLGERHPVGAVKVYTGGSEVVDGIDIYVDGAHCASNVSNSHSPTALHGGKVTTVLCGVEGTTVTVVRPGKERVLAISELEVLIYENETSPGVYPRHPAEEAAALMHVQKLFAIIPEFHATNLPLPLSGERAPEAGLVSAGLPFKAVVVVDLEGGADTFQMLTPLSGCVKDAEGGATGETEPLDLYGEWASLRRSGYVARDMLLPITVPTGTQVCDTLGIHPSLPILKHLYDDGDLAFVANMGAMVEPMNASEFFFGQKRQPFGNFGHKLMHKNIRSGDASGNSASGILGRMAASAVAMVPPWKTAIYSLSGLSEMNERPAVGGVDALNTVPLKDYSRRGAGDHPAGWAPVFTTVNSTANDLTDDISALMSNRSGSFFAETFSRKFHDTIRSMNMIYELDEMPLVSGTTFPQTDTGKALQLATNAMQFDSGVGTDRAGYYVRQEGYDAHDFLDMSEKFTELNNGLEAFVTEVKAQGLWENVTVVMVSEFGRTLTPNGIGKAAGTDHGWGGNYFVFGGAVQGGQVLGEFPRRFLETHSDVNLGRGRIRKGAAGGGSSMAAQTRLRLACLSFLLVAAIATATAVMQHRPCTNSLSPATLACCSVSLAHECLP